jgi:hypothetical protein
MKWLQNNPATDKPQKSLFFAGLSDIAGLV